MFHLLFQKLDVFAAVSPLLDEFFIYHLQNFFGFKGMCGFISRGLFQKRNGQDIYFVVYIIFGLFYEFGLFFALGFGI